VKKAAVVTFLSLLCVSYFVQSSYAQQQSAPEAVQTPTRNVAILIFNGVQIIDFTGPYETFGHAYWATQPVPFNIYTVAESSDAVTTAMGMSVNPKYTIDNSPVPDILVVPGGRVQSAIDSPKVMKWIQDSAKNSEIVMSVCNGAFILAKAGMLDGLQVTTTATLIEQLKQIAPKATVVSDKRFVDNGKIVTTAGLSSGIDGSLHIIERLYGRGTAEMAALGMEYNWDPDSTYARAALADKYMPGRFDIQSVTNSWVPVDRSGGVDHWVSKWSATSEASPADLLEQVDASFSRSDYFPRVRNIKWVKQSEQKSSDSASSLWSFADEQGNPWSGVASVDPVAGKPNTYIVTVKVNRLNGSTPTAPNTQQQ
jgi:putative intracellular protease/amidase